MLLGLLTTYAYQYNIGFQYSFGVAAFLLYLLIMNLADFTPFVRRGLLAFSAAAACLTFTAGVLPELEKTVANYADNRSLYRQMDAILETVPQEASVTASCMLVAAFGPAGGDIRNLLSSSAGYRLCGAGHAAGLPERCAGIP